MRRSAQCLLLVIALAAAFAPGPAAAQRVLPVTTGFVAAGGGDFAAMRRAGATAVKLLADWSDIEAERGELDWKALDAAVAAAAKAGLSVTLVLAYTPKWASLATGVELRDQAIWSRQPPKRISDWEQFVGQVAARYKGRVKEWQVWTALSLPIWRGTAREYFALVRAVKARTKAADPASRVVLATPYGIDLISIRRAMLEIPTAFDAIALSPRGLSPEALLAPLGVLRERLLVRGSKRLWIEWDPRALGERAGWSAQLLKVTAIAKAFGLDRVDWALDPAMATDALDVLATHLGRSAFAGYLAQSRTIALVFNESAPVAVAWSTGGDSSLALDGESVSALNAAGDPRKVAAEGGKSTVLLGSEPLLLLGLGPGVAATARETLTARGLPQIPRAQDFGQAAQVSSKLGRSNVEEGLYNMPFRGRRNGAVDVVEVGGSEAVRTVAAKDIVFIYFDVDDSFMYYVDGRHGVEVSVEVRGAAAPQQLGFNLLYDSMTGYRFTPWQWVEARDGWVTYTFQLADAAFANTWGWDFAINAGGNRKEDLTVRSVVVRKTSRP